MEIKKQHYAIGHADEKEFKKVNEILADGNDLTKHNLGQKETLLSVEGKFENGYSAILEVFTEKESVMSTAYLYNAKNDCIKHIECDENICNLYGFELEEDYYNFEIKLNSEIKKNN